MDGIVSAKARGVVFGRHKCLTRQQASELQGRRRQGTRIQTLMRDERISKATVYRYLEGVSPSQPEEPAEFV
jgi:DNA invertase Pin-like site-specific DNA recombinase